MRNFQILIVSAVKICKQCLQTVSACGGLGPPDPYWGFALGSHYVPDPWTIAWKRELLSTPLWAILPSSWRTTLPLKAGMDTHTTRRTELHQPAVYRWPAPPNAWVNEGVYISEQWEKTILNRFLNTEDTQEQHGLTLELYRETKVSRYLLRLISASV